MIQFTLWGDFFGKLAIFTRDYILMLLNFLTEAIKAVFPVGTFLSLDMTIISSLSLSMSNHLKKSCFDYFLLDDSPSRMVEVKESYDLKLWLFIIKFISLPKVIIWQIIWLANTLCHKNSQDNWCIVMLCGILNQRKSEQSPF